MTAGVATVRGEAKGVPLADMAVKVMELSEFLLGSLLGTVVRYRTPSIQISLAVPGSLLW
jgi:hypothetical protein